MHVSEFAELRAFVAVAERQNFARAADHLSMVPSTISQIIKSLEERLGVRLLNRTARKVSLTDAGMRLLARARPALMELEASVGELDQFRDTPSGTLRLNVSSVAAQIVLAPMLKTFLIAYPAIMLDVTVNNNERDIVGGRFDAGIGVGHRVARVMQRLRVTAPVRLIAIASPGYLSRNKAPATPRELRHHPCICYRSGNRQMDWVFERGKTKLEVSVSGPLVCDSMDLVVRAALDGIGIGYTIESHVADHLEQGHLVPLLREWSPAVHSYYLYYSGRGQLPAPLKALIDWFQRGQPD